MREKYQPTTISPTGPPPNHTPGATTLLPTVDGNRHNATESNEPQRKLVPARAREATAFRFLSLSAWIAPRSQGINAPLGVAVP